jgi:hypothetical protein
LGIFEPWYVQQIKIRPSENGEKSLHIELNFPDGNKFKDESGADFEVWDKAW